MGTAINASHSLFNIEPLKPLIEAGFFLLTPNFRLARRIKTVWDANQIAAGKRVWVALGVMPLEGWLLEQCAQAVELGLLEPETTLDEGRALELWQQVIEQHQSNSGKYSLLRPAAAAAMASQARETLLRWQVDVDAASIRQEFMLDDDCSTYLAWQDLFQARLRDQRLGTSADRVRQLLSVADAMPKAPVALLGFDDIPPLYQACIDACSSQWRKLDPSSEPGRRVARAFADKRSELSAVARWAMEQNVANPQATVAIVSPNMARDRIPLEQLLRREFGALGESYSALPVNFSAGTSMDRMPAVRDALQLLGLARSRITVGEIVALMQSRFVVMPDAHSPLAVKFIGGLFSDGREEITTGELRYRASQASLGDEQGLSLGEHLMTLSQMRTLRGRHRPSEWVALFGGILDLWGWPGQGPLDSQEYQQVEMWYQLLETYAGYDGISGAVALDHALQLLGRCASRKMFQPQTADSPIQVLGMLEGAGLEFDHLWICGMQGNTWPAAARPNPLIPLPLQRNLRMPHASAEREWAFASALLDRYVRCASDVIASFAQVLDGVPELPSALLEDFEHLEEPVNDSAFDPRWLDQRENHTLESLQDSSAPPVGGGQAKLLGGGSGLVEDQSHCPFRAFAKRRLKVQPLGEFQVGLSAATRGAILHDALFALWGAIGDSHVLAGMTGEAMDQIVTDAADAALKSIPSRQRMAYGQAYLQLEGRRLRTLMLEWLQVENERSDFQVQAREQEISLNIAPLEIKLRVDRIDRLADGSQLIIDYKSGRCDVKDWLGDRPSKPQLLLYGIATATDQQAQTVSALGFAQVRARDCAYVGAGCVAAAPGIRTDIVKLVGEKIQAEDWESLNKAWREILEQLVANFVAGDAAVDPLSTSSCSYCGLESFCRIGDEMEIPG